jgi:peptidylprolyl isomerase domain and WD repeat-containing protein 1
MSDTEQAATTLGKRTREEDANESADVPEMPSADMDDSSDDEIGPMPVPEAAGTAQSNGRRKKKRAGTWWNPLARINGGGTLG